MEVFRLSSHRGASDRLNNSRLGQSAQFLKQPLTPFPLKHHEPLNCVEPVSGQFIEPPEGNVHLLEVVQEEEVGPGLALYVPTPYPVGDGLRYADKGRVTPKWVLEAHSGRVDESLAVVREQNIPSLYVFPQTFLADPQTPCPQRTGGVLSSKCACKFLVSDIKLLKTNSVGYAPIDVHHKARGQEDLAHASVATGSGPKRLPVGITQAPSGSTRRMC